MLLGAGSKISPSAYAADLMIRWSSPLSEWTPPHAGSTTHRLCNVPRAGQPLGPDAHKLTWLVLGEDPAARSHRVEQL